MAGLRNTFILHDIRRSNPGISLYEAIVGSLRGVMHPDETLGLGWQSLWGAAGSTAQGTRPYLWSSSLWADNSCSAALVGRVGKISLEAGALKGRIAVGIKCHDAGFQLQTACLSASIHRGFLLWGPEHKNRMIWDPF